MSRNSRGCSGGGGFTFGCLVIIGVYAVLLSVAFTIVTVLYMTLESCEKNEADVAKGRVQKKKKIVEFSTKRLTHPPPVSGEKNKKQKRISSFGI